MSRKDGAGTADTVTDSVAATSVSATSETQPGSLASDATQPGSVVPQSTSPDAYGSFVTVDRTHYVIGRPIARGGMGRISAARDRRLDRDVAIKEVLGSDDSLISRFEREARITARLQHPAIVPLYEAGRWPSGEPFYAMKLVSGEPLDKIIAKATTLSARLALLPNVIAVVDALAYAHAEGVIHRDLKPSNVLIGAFGETVVIDWGLAKELGSTDRDPSVPPRRRIADGETVGVLGTPAYMPPEQAAGQIVDARADVYALGALLYHVLAGTAPYSGQTVDELIDQVLRGPPVALAERAPDAPADLLAIVARAMARDPADRFATANEMADELKRFQTGQLVASHRYSVSELARRWIRRHRGIAATLALATLVAAVGIVWFLSRERILRTTAEHSSKEAEVARGRAERALDANLLEQGRVELQALRPARAAAFLAAAYVTLAEDPAARFLMAQSLRDVERRSRVFKDNASISPAVLSPDNTRLVTANNNETVKLWDVRTGVATPLIGLRGMVSSIAFTPDGTRFATTAYENNTIQIWDSKTGTLALAIEAHRPPHAFAFSQDGTRILAPDERDTASIWDASTGTLLVTLRGHTQRIVMAAFSPDGERVVTASEDHSAKVWDARSGTLLVTLAGHQNRVWSAAFSRDGARIVTAAQDNTAKVWTTTGTLLTTLAGHTAELWHATFSPDGTQVLTVSWDATAKIWNWAAAVDKQLVATVGHLEIAQEPPEFSPDGTKVVTSWGQAGRIWDARTGALLATLDGHTEDVLSVKWSVDGSQIVTASADGTAQLWSAHVVPPTIIQTGTWLRSAAYSADGAHVVTAGDTVATIRDARTGRVETTLDHPSNVAEAAFRADGAHVVTAGADGSAAIWDVRTGKRLATLVGHTQTVRSAAFSADGLRVVTAGEDKTAKIWDARTGALVLTLQETKEMASAAFSPDGGRVVTTCASGTTKIWNAKTGAVIKELPIAGLSAAFSPDGTRVVTASDNTAKIWDARSGRLVVTLEGHTSSVLTASYSADGSRIVTSSNDRTARVWSARTGELLATLTGHTHDVVSAAFSPDGSHVLTASHDTTLRIWDVRLETRSLEEITRIVAESSPWQIVDGLLTRR
jgi:eukaryotic-like serine/threonine-protein kinase